MPVIRPLRIIGVRRDERGAVAVITGVSMLMLLVATAMVLDFGLVRLDRQNIKATADNAVMSGIAVGDSGAGQMYSYRAVCAALSFARTDRRLAALPDDICAPGSLAAVESVKCTTAAATHATYSGSVTSGGATYSVVIKSPYITSSGGWSEENFQSVSPDQSAVDGCDQVGLEISIGRKPGLGSLATSSDLETGLRSAARAVDDPQSLISPALVLLERSSCSVLTVGAAGGGTGTYINVKGFDGTPGSIHADSAATGSDCGSGSNQQLFQGKQNDGIVAFGSLTPPGASGIISSVASYNGVAENIVSDSSDKVYGTPSITGTGTVKNPVQGRRQVSRSPVDLRYRAAVRNAITAARGVWASTSTRPATTPPDGTWTSAGCAPTAAQLAVTTKLWIDCNANSGITIDGEIKASEIYFRGFVKGGNISMPNATRVYISNRASDGTTVSSSALSLGNNNGFCVRSSCAATAPSCPATPTAGRAQVFIRQGNVSVTGGTLRMCNSTVILLGGDTDYGCVPATDGLPPTDTACAGASVGSRIDVAGSGAFDWTAPNQYSGAIPVSDQETAWANFEDLAAWAETPGLYSFAGGGGMQTVGVYMVPNANPVKVGGGSSQVLRNAQYIARKFAVSGGGTLTLSTDPRNAVTIPNPQYVLVR